MASCFDLQTSETPISSSSSEPKIGKRMVCFEAWVLHRYLHRDAHGYILNGGCGSCKYCIHRCHSDLASHGPLLKKRCPSKISRKVTASFIRNVAHVITARAFSSHSQGRSISARFETNLSTAGAEAFEVRS